MFNYFCIIQTAETNEHVIMTVLTQVLRCFKSLHRTRKTVFAGDTVALNIVRNRINDEFVKNKNVTNASAVSELIKFAHEVDQEIRSTVIQAAEVKSGKYELRITKDTFKFDNTPYKDVPEDVLKISKRPEKCKEP